MFENYLGRKQCNGFADPLTREGCALWLARVLGYYGDDARQVDIGIIDGQLPLTAETADYLYRDFTPTTVSYRRGDRPMLEAVVNSVVTPGMGERDKALALLRRCRDNPKSRQIADNWGFCGGSEEELIKRGAIMCNEISRVFACLGQVAGLPTRVFCSHLTGHMMNEVFVEGRWWWVDVMFGIYCFLDDGRPASAWELMQDRDLFNRQKRATWADWVDQGRGPFPAAHPRAVELNRAYRVIRYRDCYFNPKEAVALGNYFAADHRRFSYPWRSAGVDPAAEADARHRLALVIRKLNWPDLYWSYQLFNEPLKTAD